MNKLLGRGPGWVFLERPGDPYARWYKIETVDLLSKFDSPTDDVVRCTYEDTGSGSEDSSPIFV